MIITCKLYTDTKIKIIKTMKVKLLRDIFFFFFWPTRSKKKKKKKEEVEEGEEEEEEEEGYVLMS